MLKSLQRRLSGIRICATDREYSAELKEYARKYDFHRFSRRVELIRRRARVDYVTNRNEAGFFRRTWVVQR